MRSCTRYCSPFSVGKIGKKYFRKKYIFKNEKYSTNRVRERQKSEKFENFSPSRLIIGKLSKNNNENMFGCFLNKLNIKKQITELKPINLQLIKTTF